MVAVNFSVLPQVHFP